MSASFRWTVYVSFQFFGGPQGVALVGVALSPPRRPGMSKFSCSVSVAVIFGVSEAGTVAVGGSSVGGGLSVREGVSVASGVPAGGVAELAGVPAWATA